MKTILAAAVVAVAFAATPTLAADAPEMMMVDEEAMSYATSNWDGFYVGVTGSYYAPAGVGEFAGVAGVNFMPSESFLIGVEARAGFYFLAATGIDASLSARAGFVAGDALVYGTVGGWYDVTSGGPVYPYAGGGVEFMVGDSASIRFQGVYYLTSGNFEVGTGLLWHFN
jgi:opacity protein-like surface antigen